MAINMDDVLQSKIENEKAMNSGGFFKIEHGKNKLRILPPYKLTDGQGVQHYVKSIAQCNVGRGRPWAEGWFHYQMGPEGKTTVLCVSSTYRQHCPICEALERIKSSPNAADKTKYEESKAKIRIFYNVAMWERQPNSSDQFLDQAKVGVLPVGRMIHKDILGLLSDPEYGDITDPLQGNQITIEKSGRGTKEDTKYQVRPSPSKTSIPEEWIASMKNLDELLLPPSAEELEQLSQELLIGGSHTAQIQAPQYPQAQGGYPQPMQPMNPGYPPQAPVQQMPPVQGYPQPMQPLHQAPAPGYPPQAPVQQQAPVPNYPPQAQAPVPFDPNKGQRAH